MHGQALHSGGIARGEQRRRLWLALLLAAAYLVAETAGGLWTGSLALLADAGHMLGDVSALALSLFALWLADQKAPAARTFGYRRMEILAALANGVALVGVALGIGFEAFARLLGDAPRAIPGAPMFAIAAGGLLVNLAGLAILQSGRSSSLNLRAAWLHVLSDALGSAGAMLAGALIWARGWWVADPAASLLISALLLRSAFVLLRETVDVLLEAAPGGLDVEALRAALTAAPGVAAVHDLHVWTITSGMVSLSCHVHASGETGDHALLSQLQTLLRQRFGIQHMTLQIEPLGFEEAVEVC